MIVKQVVRVVIVTAAMVSASVSAQDTAPANAQSEEPDGASASAGFSLSSDEGADASASASGSGNATPWIDRYPPEAGLIELGIFGGLMLPSSKHSLYPLSLPQSERQNYDSPSLDLGLRAAFYPLAFLGLEGELAYIPTGTDDGASASWISARAHVVGQIPGMSITPFALLGVGSLIASSDAMGDDTDGAVQIGIGAKAAISRYFSLRLDLRDNLSNSDVGTDSVPHHIEVLLGLTLTLGRSDSDGDDFLDTMDKCPNEAGVSPDGCPAAVDSDSDGFLDPDDKCVHEPGIAPDGCPDPDRDKDGILNDADACPDTAGVQPHGCPDTDGDGFRDSEDKCPNEAGVAPDGCPDLDPDKDGVLIPNDKCETEPETRNGYQDEDGCPDEVPEEVKKFTGVIQGIKFATGKATIRPQSFRHLKKAAKVLVDYGDLRVMISGHTDNVGSDVKNMQLSADRAAAVKTYLSEQGVTEDRIETVGKGETEPVGDNETDEGRQENRRIEFKLIGAAPQSAAAPAPAPAPAEAAPATPAPAPAEAKPAVQ